jgi:hypothetical protein
MRLRCVDELYPEIINAKLDARDTLPACSAAEPLVRQEPYMNSMLAQQLLPCSHGCFGTEKSRTTEDLSVRKQDGLVL